MNKFLGNYFIGFILGMACGAIYIMLTAEACKIVN